MKNLFFVFLQCAEAWKTSFWSFWNVQKREKLLFGLSEMFRSVKNFFLVFLKRSEACFFLFLPFRATLKHLKSSISCLCRCQKHQFSFFHAYVVVRNDYFLHFVLMSLSEAPIFFFSCLCRWQKHLFSSFRVYVVVRSDYFLHFVFMSLTEAWKNSF